MNRTKALRLTGFVGALAASATLVGMAASGTGAYFSDTHGGEIDASTGHIRVSTTPADGKLSFTNLLPGEYANQTISYTASVLGNNPSDTEDVWLVFPTTGGPGGTNPSEAFTGNPKDSAGGGLGRYGHFAVSAPAGSFTSYNLSNEPPAGSGDSGPTCTVDANGHGGSDQQAANRSDYSVPFCGVPGAILLSSGMPNGQTDKATLTFGFTPLLTGPQDAPLNKVVNYEIVATQHGIRPDNPNN